MKKLIVGSLFGLLLLPTVASAHHNTVSVTPSCETYEFKATAVGYSSERMVVVTKNNLVVYSDITNTSGVFYTDTGSVPLSAGVYEVFMFQQDADTGGGDGDHFDLEPTIGATFNGAGDLNPNWNGGANSDDDDAGDVDVQADYDANLSAEPTNCPPPEDVCPEEGLQTEGPCEGEDVCPNMEGIQTNPEDCPPPPEDVCPDLEGTQASTEECPTPEEPEEPQDSNDGGGSSGGGGVSCKKSDGKHWEYYRSDNPNSERELRRCVSDDDTDPPVINTGGGAAEVPLSNLPYTGLSATSTVLYGALLVLAGAVLGWVARGPKPKKMVE